MDSDCLEFISKRYGTDMKNWIDSTVDSFEREQREQDRRPLTEKADPLALAWTAYHVWEKFPNRRWAEWRDLEACKHDKEMADETRRYYRNKLALRALKGNSEPTQFSRDLYDICNGGIMRECHKGMLYRLPYFYVEDIRRAELIEHTQSQPTLDIPLFLQGKSTQQLKPHRRIFHSRRSRETMEYWYHDVKTGYAVLWSVAYDNPLRSLVDHHFRTEETTNIYAYWKLGHDRVNNFQFLVLMEPEFRVE